MTYSSPQNLPQVFISHSGDNSFLKKLATDLVNTYSKDSVWYDKSKLKGGHEWWDKIVSEISSREIFVIIITEKSMDSKWVSDELNIAWYQKNTSGKRIIPIILRNCTTIRADLNTLHQIRFDKLSYQKAFQELTAAISSALSVRFDTEENNKYDERSQKLLRFDGPDLNTVYLDIGNNTLRGFQDGKTFEFLGFDWGEIDVFNENDRSKFKIIEPLSKVSESRKVRLRYNNGSFANEIFLVWDDGKKHHIPDPYTLLNIGGKEIETVDFNTFKSLPFGKPIRSMFDINSRQVVRKAMEEQLNKK